VGVKDPERPNISTTLWRTVADTGAKRYFYESALSPSVFWVDLNKLDLSTLGKTMQLDLHVAARARRRGFGGVQAGRAVQVHRARKLILRPSSLCHWCSCSRLRRPE
jgi:hypothetical protein